MCYQVIASRQILSVQFGNNAHINYEYLGVNMPGNGIDAVSSGKNCLDHGAGHLLWIGTDPRVDNPVIAGHYQNCLAFD